MTSPHPGKFHLIHPPPPNSFGEALYKSFLEAIYVLFKQGYGVSGLKLLLSALDTMAFLTTGNDNAGSDFKKWLDKYVDLNAVGIDSDELWEHRNALLHMTRFHSKAVHKGKVKFLVPSYREAPQEYKDRLKSEMDALYGTNYKFYSTVKLFNAVADGINKFVAEVKTDSVLRATVKSNFGEIIPDIPIGVTRTREPNLPLE